MSDWQSLASYYARKYGFPEDVFTAQMGQEAHGQDLTSGAGAQGPAQIMPATAVAWGVKNPHDIKQAYDAAARHMAGYLKQYGSVKNALVAYNAGPGRVGKDLPAETQNYLDVILGHRGSSSAPNPVSLSSNASMYGSVAGSTVDAPKTPSVFDVIAQYRNATAPRPLIGQQPQGGLGQIYDPQKSQQTIQTILGMGTQPPAPRSFQPTFGASAPSAPVVSGGLQGGQRGKFNITGANPSRLQPQIVDFAQRLAARVGHPISGDSGASHSKFTVDGNISEHYTGNATDIPSSGQQLTRLGQQALIEAGMDPAEAHKQTGGLFNITGPNGERYQIIFNTMQGGNHYTHLHVGYRAGKK